MIPKQPFEPDYLINLLHAQYPQRIDVLRALRLCPHGHWENNAYIQFIADRQTPSGTDHLVVESLILEDNHQGKIVVDVVADGRIAGIAFEPQPA